MGARRDITGQTFGHLKAVRCTGEKIGGSYVWEFECLLCGRHIFQRIGRVTSGEVVSCGCYREENRIKNLKGKPIQEKLGLVHNTNVSRIMSVNLPQNNTSGHKGVYLHRQKGRSDRWVAYIYFQKTRYHLGSFERKEDAIKAREEAEQALFGGFLEWYNNKKTK